MKYITTRLIAALLIAVPEFWACFYFATRPWFEQWAENALMWQMLLTSIALLVWVFRGESEFERKGR